MTTNESSPAVTEADVHAKMNELGIRGYHSTEVLPPDVHMDCLKEIERTIQGGRQAFEQGLQQ